MQDKKIWEWGMDFTETEHIITDCKKCSELSSNGDRKNVWERVTEKVRKKYISLSCA